MIRPSVKVCYVEASAKMIELSKKRVEGADVLFIHGTEADIPEEVYDVVITNFYLDLFTGGALPGIINRILPVLKNDGQWIVADFVNQGKWWQSFLLTLMYSFFYMFTGINSRELPDWEYALQKDGMLRVDSLDFYRGFIKSGVFRPTNV